MKAAWSGFISNFMYGFAKYTMVCILMIGIVFRLIKPRFNGKMVNNQRKSIFKNILANYKTYLFLLIFLK